VSSVCWIAVTNIDALYQQYLPDDALRAPLKKKLWGFKQFTGSLHPGKKFAPQAKVRHQYRGCGRASVCLKSQHPFWQCMRRMIHAIPIVIQKAGSPMIGLPARIALFVVVDVPLLRVCFSVEIEDQVFT